MSGPPRFILGPDGRPIMVSGTIPQMVPLQVVGSNAPSQFVTQGGQFVTAPGYPVQMQLPPTQLLSQPPPSVIRQPDGSSGKPADPMDEDRLRDKGEGFIHHYRLYYSVFMY